MRLVGILTFVFMATLSLSAQDKELEEKVNNLVSELTLEEKISLCSGRDDWSTQPIERLDIPWIWMADGPHGLRRAPATNKAGYGDQHPATCFPTASALSATWDTDLIYKVGQALGEECQALGVNVLLGPGVNIKRSVLGGRNFEYFTEDPVLSGELGAAYINGVQSQGVGTSLKHFVANNVETMRMFMNSDVDMRTLHEIYLTPFEIAVKKAQPWTVMACYNRVQGEYGTQSPYLLTSLLKEEWGFKGMVISDWFAVVDRVAALKAGMHIEMPHVSSVNDEILLKAVQQGELDEAILDNLVKEILMVVLKAKSLDREDVEQKVGEHHQFAREVHGQAITLLKNDGNVLPLSKDKYKKIAIIGEFAANPRYQGNGSSEVKPTQLDNVLDIIKKEYGKGVKISYAQGYNLKDDNDFTMVEEAVQLAKESDVALVFAGLPLHYESEGIDRKHIDMPAAHNQLIAEVAKVQNNTVAVLTNGSAVAMPWIEQVPAVLETWLGGQAGAGAVADVLFGTVNPSGKLAETFPVKLADTPAAFNFPGEQGNVLYGERIFVGYRYYDEKQIEPLFPFGHGLSYTTFDYSDIQLSAKKISDKDALVVTLKVKNTGAIAGKETVQLYVSDLESTLQRPEKELKHFIKVELQPGETKEVSFELSGRDFSYYDARRDMWIAESGNFEIMAAASSRDIRLKANFELESTQQVPMMVDKYTFAKELWDNQETRELLKEYMPNWINGWVPEGKTMDEANIPGFFMEHPMIKFPYITNHEITHEQVDELIERCKNITYTPSYRTFKEVENVSF
ncbi:glycoside hydrolase family 3 C-terminal domain-containing protein [Carboxylicivirga mesophila]|uniref:Glycoside hydrolase family 3 C-terminal domain-containing protein n=1 Tax=Carboxylicivirga mesophila TaxID=1166478 RepID=A0ABS5K5Q9_9BACT|nr:glycoside hydrolase family 3 C-terminal domain-containing protein [Carboxylicivirga mesophila]MBS2210313.1 glycoside hydrolase family 3 C-terminal domain-containing protein [Carboxylicivirga mesophila]